MNKSEAFSTVESILNSNFKLFNLNISFESADLIMIRLVAKEFEGVSLLNRIKSVVRLLEEHETLVKEYTIVVLPLTLEEWKEAGFEKV